MSEYRAPLAAMLFTLEHVVGWENLSKMTDLGGDDIKMILESAGDLATEILSPLNASGDREGSRWADGVVTTPKGFAAAYAAYRDGGWNSVPFTDEYGGQNLPWLIAFPLQEMWQSANMSFGLCPLLNQAAVEAIAHHGTQEQKDTYLAKLISGEWTGTMNLTEPDAGSDLAAVKSKAVPQDDGTYRLFGQKIFITYGEHDFADNIIHLTLARLPDAPEGVKGISLFIVPKFIPDAQGNPGQRNDVKCVSIEHKLGIHASPTCTMQYGDEGGAVAYLVGQPHEGLKYMFTMMNNARLCVGLQGVALAERAYQHAVAYARERKQGTKLADKGGTRVAIIEHADVQRMLLSMKARIEASRALAYEAARYLDRANEGDAQAQARVDLLTPVVKSWSTDIANEVASLGVQIHGGMGFIEETGAAQFLRDARILPIYEGTNGIQAQDLAFRKVLMDKGAAVKSWTDEARAAATAGALDDEATLQAFETALDTWQEATDWVLQKGAANDPAAVAAVAAPYQNAFGLVAGGYMMLRTAQAAQRLLTAGQGDSAFLQARIATARFYMTHILPGVTGLVDTVRQGSAPVTDFPVDQY